MKVTISSTGGTHRIIELAGELDRMGHLHWLYIPFYSRKHPYLTRFFSRAEDRQNIDIGKIKTNLPYSLLRKARKQFGAAFNNPRSFFLSEMFDKWVSRNISNDEHDLTDIVMPEPIVALHTIRKAREMGIMTMLDTTNSHILNQREILDKEYDRLGIRYNFNPSNIIEKGVKEYEEADHLILRSSYVRRTFLERDVPEEKLHVVLSGVDLEDFRWADKEDNVFRVIYCGLSCIKKGTHYLLQAFKELKLKNAELWLIGDIFEDIKPLIKQYEGCYRSIPFVRRQELYKYYSQGSIFVLPSLEEGLSKVMIEAMACGLPVIATINTGAEDVIRDGKDGFIIPIKDVEALKEKILYMYENQSVCTEMGQSAEERVNEKFTLKAYAGRMFDILNTVLDKKADK
jgi:glycosyltransferase involved in cell wall biosynthesis